MGLYRKFPFFISHFKNSSFRVFQSVSVYFYKYNARHLKYDNKQNLKFIESENEIEKEIKLPVKLNHKIIVLMNIIDVTSFFLVNEPKSLWIHQC